MNRRSDLLDLRSQILRSAFVRGETSIHMESPRPKRPSRPPIQDDAREPTDYVILKRTHSAEIANHLLDVQTQMRRLEEERQGNEESKSESESESEEKKPPLVALESPPN